MAIVARLRRPPSLAGLVGAVIVLSGLFIGLSPLDDNSFFTHLATGKLILKDHSIPTTDPYSFTAHGRAWTVQSWGASLIYAVVGKVFGFNGIRVLVAICCTAISLLVWRLTSPAKGLVGRLAIAVPVIAVGAGFWVERPLIFSLVFLLAVLFALEDRLDPRWLVPIMWAWVNIHGSFPIALIAIVVFGVGRLLDDRKLPRVELRVFGFAALGTLIGGIISPLSWHLLVFPVQLLQRKEAFAHIAEWQSPHWDSWSERFFAIQVVLALVLILWRGRRWRNILPVLVFTALSLQASRNIVHASLIMIPAMAAAAHGLGVLDGLQPKRSLRPIRTVLIALYVLLAVGAVVYQAPTDLHEYPVASVTHLRQNHLLGVHDRLVTRDFVGNYLELRYGPKVRTFIDDRVDMYPDQVINQYAELLDRKGDYAKTLHDVGASAVLWDTDSPFGDWLENPENGWKIVYREPGWMVAVPAGSPAAAD